MGHLYFNKLKVYKNSKKLNYFSPNIWRSMYLISLNPVHQTSEKRIRTRNSAIPNIYKGYEVVIHAGKRWHCRQVSRWMVGHRFGEFTWNRKYALFKAKQLRKKKSKNKK